jgi:pre-mRNA-splicing factor CWC26
MYYVCVGMADKQEDTVYRDKRGRKLDMLNEFMRQQASREGKEVKMEQAQYEWGKGIVQKEAAEDAQKELERIASEPFARTIDDPRLEVAKKSVSALTDLAISNDLMVLM